MPNKVKLHLHWDTWQRLAGSQAVVAVSGSTTGECLEDLVREFPAIKQELFDKDGGLLEYLSVFVNREVAFPDELTKPVKHGDEIHIIPLIGGG
jgi:molybdopterin converting factor small subunit